MGMKKKRAVCWIRKGGEKEMWEMRNKIQGEVKN